MPSRDVLTQDELGQIRNLDRILPCQPILANYFNGDQAQFYPRLESLLHSVLPTRTLKGCVVETVTRLAKSGAKYDLVLIDAAKQSYGEMLDPALACLNPGGLVLVDDVFMNGDTLNLAPSLDKGEGVRALLDKVSAIKDDLSKVILPIGNGLLLIHAHGGIRRGAASAD